VFIDEASRLCADALKRDQPDVGELARVYAMVGRTQGLSSSPAIQTAEKTL